MKFKTKSRICTGIVTLALGMIFIYSSSSAATVTKTVQCGDSGSAIVTATISLGDKGVVAKNKYLYNYCATLRGPYFEAAQNAKVDISGAVSITLALSSSKDVYPVVSGKSTTNWIEAKASMKGYDANSVKITK